MIFRNFNFSLNFNLSEVYKVRSIYKEMEIPLSGYFFNWIAKVINPIFFAYFVVRKKLFPIVLIVLLQILLFSFTGHKNYLFSLPFILFLMWVIKQKNPLTFLCIGLTGIVKLGMLSYFFTYNLWISSLFTRRALLVLAKLSFLYYDFFSQNQLNTLKYFWIYKFVKIS
jgi:hypothetical protein